MQNLLNELKQLLQQDERCVAEGQLLKNKAIELALAVDTGLIKLLLKNKSIKKHFFTDTDGVLVFDKIKFQHFVSNKEFLPDSYTAFKNKIGLANENGDYLSESREVVLAWPYKDCVLEGGQTKEDQKRDEIFWNETLAPDEIDRLFGSKVFTGFRRYDRKGAHALKGNEKIDYAKENIIIRGNNLLALYSLLKKYPGRVKLIYIDPPFNTGTDSFQYNDNFNQSTWLTFLRKRLQVAIELLAEDGLIFVHLDDNEDAYVKIVMDEIFMRDNFVASIAVKSATPSGVKTAHKNKTIINTKNSIHIYRKSPKATINPQYARRSGWDTHFSIYLQRKNDKICSLSEIMRKRGLLKKDEDISNIDMNNETHYDFYISEAANIFQSKSHSNEQARKASLAHPNRPYFVNKNEKDEEVFLNGRQLWPLAKNINSILVKDEIKKDFSYLLGDFWSDIDFNNMQNEGGIEFPKGKKPESLLHRIISLGTQPGDLILDFFLGSGTTAAVAHKMGRQYFGIEQLDYGKDDCVHRLNNVIQGESNGISKAVNWKGGGSFIYCELLEWNEAYNSQIKKTKTSRELIAIWEEMQSKAFISYKVDPKAMNDNIKDFKELSLADQKRFLIEVLDKNQLYVNYSEIDDKEYGVSETDKKLNQQFYDEA
jgi:adenine-specific DNA-methyltransferase